MVLTKIVFGCMFEEKKLVKDGFAPQASDYVKVEPEIKQKVNRGTDIETV